MTPTDTPAPSATLTVEEFLGNVLLDPVTTWRRAQIGGVLDYVAAEDLIKAGLTRSQMAAWTANRPAHQVVGGPPANDPVWLACALDEFANTHPEMALGEAAGWVIVAFATNADPVTLATQWVSSVSVGGWRCHAAGMGRDEAVSAVADGGLPPRDRLVTLAALRGVTLPD